MPDTVGLALLRRGLFHHDGDDSSSTTCPALPTPLDDADVVVGAFTVHQFLLILGVASAAIATIVSFLLFFLHAFNVRRPLEQIKIMRIVTFIPVFSIIAVINIAAGQSSIYIQPWANLYEAVCLCTFYLLVHSYIAPTVEEQAVFFARLPRKAGAAGRSGGDNSSAFWRRTQLATFQVIPVEFIVAIATDVSQGVGTYCINSNKPHFAHIWLTVLHGLSTTVAVLSVIRFTYRLKPEFPHLNLPRQLWAFKLIVGLCTAQTFGFSVAAGQAHPTNALSYNDIAVGLPNALIAVETVGVSIFFMVAYGWRRYVPGGAGAISPDGQKQQRVVMGALPAIFKALIPLDVFVAMFQVFTGRWNAGRRIDDRSSQMEPLHVDTGYYQTAQHWPAAAPREDPQAYEGHTHYIPDGVRPPSYTPVGRHDNRF